MRTWMMSRTCEYSIIMCMKKVSAMEIKITPEKIASQVFADLLEDIMLHAQSVSETYDAKSDFSQGMA